MDGWPELLPWTRACLAIPTPAPVWLLQVTTAVGPEQPCVVYERPPPLPD